MKRTWCCRIILSVLFIASLGHRALGADALSAPSTGSGNEAGVQNAGSPPGAPEAAAEPIPVLEPLFVRPLSRIESGRNDSNPQWGPPGTLLAFERSRGDKKEIHIVYADGTPVEKVYFQLSGDGKDANKFFFPGVYEEVSYNAGITWSAGGDRFVFMSNGGEGNYDLYLQELGRTAARLTDHKEKDGHAHWSPAGDRIVFVSGRTGNGDMYVMDLPTKALTRLTHGGAPYLYPQWSPNGRRIVMMHGSNENHDIVLMTDPSRPAESRKALTTWPADDLRPVWSPDGSKIAFYSNYNAGNDPKIWSIVVVAADGTDPTEGQELAAKIVAADVIPDVEAGPAWMPDSAQIIYVKNDRHEYNPIYIADVKQKTTMAIKTDTKMNHDVACSADGTVAFRAQVNQWDQIFVLRLK